MRLFIFLFLVVSLSNLNTPFAMMQEKVGGKIEAKEVKLGQKIEAKEVKLDVIKVKEKKDTVPTIPKKKYDDPDQEQLALADLSFQTEDLIAFLEARCRLDVSVEEMQSLVGILGDSDTAKAQRAMQQLIQRGSASIPFLRQAANDPAEETKANRARTCLKWIEPPSHAAVTSATVRLLAKANPPETVDLLLKFLPFAEEPSVLDTVQKTLTELAYSKGQISPALLKALESSQALQRAIAVDVLTRPDQPDLLPKIRKLLNDPKAFVRYRTGMALARLDDMESIPVLIDLLDQTNTDQRAMIVETLRSLSQERYPDTKLSPTNDAEKAELKKLWQTWWQKSEGEELLAEFRKRTLREEDLPKVKQMIAQLGHRSFQVREKASKDLVEQGAKILPLLREAAKDKEEERSFRAKNCIDQIQLSPQRRVPLGTARLAALRRVPDAVKAMLDYVPFASEDDPILEEIRSALVASIVNNQGKIDPLLIESLQDANRNRRLIAIDVLCQVGHQESFPTIRSFVQKEDLQIRLRSAVSLVAAGDKQSVPALIDLLEVLPPTDSWPAIELLAPLNPNPPYLKEDTVVNRKKLRDEWATWWKENEAKIDLRPLNRNTPFSQLGYTLLIEVGDNQQGRVTELDRNNKPRWSITGLQYPVDAFVLPGDRILVCEWGGRRITERNMKSEIVWSVDNIDQPVNVYRMRNGNTFVVTRSEMMEVDRNGKKITTHRPGGTICCGYKKADGGVIYIDGKGTCHILDSNFKEIRTFQTNRNDSWTSGIDVLPNGNILVSQPNISKVTEFDSLGKQIWTADVTSITTAIRLPNGNTLTASHGRNMVEELDRTGKVIWKYNSDMHIFRARRR